MQAITLFFGKFANQIPIIVSSEGGYQTVLQVEKLGVIATCLHIVTCIYENYGAKIRSHILF